MEVKLLCAVFNQSHLESPGAALVGSEANNELE